MSILFSPIGTADPLTSLGEAAMLHIVRHRVPDKVVLFLTPKMQGYQETDARYSRAIELLCEGEGRPVPDIRCESSEEQDVFRFDVYIDEFEEILSQLCVESPDEPVLVNVSSGTPGMQQALVAIGSFGRLPLELLQVPTPKRDANAPGDRENPDDYDLDTLWLLNEELREGDPAARESRIIRVETPNFANQLLRENIATLVKQYDYKAAFELACCARGLAEDVVRMIEAARDRLNLDGALPSQVFAKSPLAYRPNDLLGEYLAVMQARLTQGNWADFVRLLSPAFTRIARNELQRNGLPERSYLIVENGEVTSRLNWNAIQNDPQLKRVMDDGRQNKPKYITNDGLIRLVEEYVVDGRIEQKLSALRKFERECRHMLAHEMRSSRRDALERLGGLSLDEVMQYLYELHGSARLHLYDDINQAILARL